MTSAPLLAAIVAAAGIAACAGTRALIPLLRRAAVLDRPNARSSHDVPTPRGGGIAVTAAILSAWLAVIAAGAASPHLAAVLAGAALLAAVSWIDDRGGLSPVPRLVVQCVAVSFGMLAAAPAGPLFQGWLPAWLDRVAAALAWIWFANLFNFMDGIDGLAASEAAAVGIGLALFAGAAVGEAGPAALAAVTAAAALGFLVWNWAPARIFLGDVGSVPLGYLLGYLLLDTAEHGHWRIALVLPLYFLADATTTLVRRLLRGERVWRPHREHFYQRAVQRGAGHADIVRWVVAADLMLIGCGWAAESGWPVAALAAAAVVVAALLAGLAGLRPAGANPIPAAERRIEEPPK